MCFLKITAFDFVITSITLLNTLGKSVNPAQYPAIGTPLFYGVFAVVVIIMIAIDMLALKKNGAHKVSIKKPSLGPSFGWPSHAPSLAGCIGI